MHTLIRAVNFQPLSKWKIHGIELSEKKGYEFKEGVNVIDLSGGKK